MVSKLNGTIVWYNAKNWRKNLFDVDDCRTHQFYRYFPFVSLTILYKGWTVDKARIVGIKVIIHKLTNHVDDIIYEK